MYPYKYQRRGEAYEKIIKKMFIYLGVIVTLGIVAVSMYHYRMVQKEEAVLRNNGMMVNVHGQRMNVYQEGMGRIHMFLWQDQALRLLFMS